MVLFGVLGVPVDHPAGGNRIVASFPALWDGLPHAARQLLSAAHGDKIMHKFKGRGKGSCPETLRAASMGAPTTRNIVMEGTEACSPPLSLSLPSPLALFAVLSPGSLFFWPVLLSCRSLRNLFNRTSACPAGNLCFPYFSLLLHLRYAAGCLRIFVASP